MRSASHRVRATRPPISSPPAGQACASSLPRARRERRRVDQARLRRRQDRAEHRDHRRPSLSAVCASARGRAPPPWHVGWLFVTVNVWYSAHRRRCFPRARSRWMRGPGPGSGGRQVDREGRCPRGEGQHDHEAAAPAGHGGELAAVDADPPRRVRRRQPRHPVRPVAARASLPNLRDLLRRRKPAPAHAYLDDRFLTNLPSTTMPAWTSIMTGNAGAAETGVAQLQRVLQSARTKTCSRARRTGMSFRRRRADARRDLHRRVPRSPDRQADALRADPPAGSGGARVGGDEPRGPRRR